jgi:hypothetical protein
MDFSIARPVSNDSSARDVVSMARRSPPGQIERIAADHQLQTARFGYWPIDSGARPDDRASAGAMMSAAGLPRSS